LAAQVASSSQGFFFGGKNSWTKNNILVKNSFSL
jgi:hypothetical protein